MDMHSGVLGVADVELSSNAAASHSFNCCPSQGRKDYVVTRCMWQTTHHFISCRLASSKSMKWY